MADNGKGALFKNDKKREDKHPDYTGNFVLTRDLLEAYRKEMGTASEFKVQVAAWLKQGKRDKFLSLSVSAPYQGERKGRKRDEEEDIPF